jgi:glutathionylspermidine synthase
VQRHNIHPRDGWQNKVSDLGLVYNQLPNGKPYWNESAYYSFTAAEVDALEAATNRLQEIYLEAGQFIIDNNRFADLGIPEAAIPLIKWSWETEPPAIYGRFDLAYDGTGPAKLLEYNADTPTALLEASVIQWYWLNEQFPSADQFNSIHERLVDKWRELKNYLAATLYVAHVHDEALEDVMTATYLRDTAQEAELATAGILMKDLGWGSKTQQFVDYQGHAVRSLFKLYPLGMDRT